MEVSKERLSIIGRMIGIYREERRGNTQNSYTQKRFCKDICSTNTLKNVEKGEIARSTDVYDELLAKFDLLLGEFPAIDMAILKLTDDLYEAIEFYLYDEMIKILNKILRVLSKVKNYVYYSELELLFENVKTYYLEGDFIEGRLVENYKTFLKLLPRKYSDFFRFLVYVKLKPESIGNKKKYEKLVRDVELERSNNNFVKMGLIDFYYITDRYKKMENLIDELIGFFTKEDKIVRQFDVYNYAIVLLSKIEYEKCIQYIHQSEDMLSKHEIPELKKSELFGNIAVAHQINRNYKIALEYFNRMLSIKHRDYIDWYILMADCQNHLEIQANIPLVKEDLYMQYPNDVKLMYKYFTLGSDIPAFAKENYILKKILPNLTDKDYIGIFHFEIIRLVKITGHYKSTQQFDLKIEENSMMVS